MINLMNELFKPKYHEELILKGLNVDVKDLLSKVIEGYIWTPPRLVRVLKPDGISYRELFIFNEYDSYLQKLIYQILYKHYNKDVSDNVFSYRKRTTTFDAARLIQKDMRHNGVNALQLDISDYFGSVKNSIIHECIDSLVGEGKELLHSLFNVNSYYYGDKLYQKQLGIMAGSALSVFFANYLLKDIDSFIVSKSVTYARYSDDLLFVCNTNSECDLLLHEVQLLLADMGLTINPKKVKVYNNSNSIDFLGLTITANHIDINKETFKTTKRNIKHICKVSKTTRSAIRAINRILYKTIFSVSDKHKCGRMHYIFRNITTDKTLRELDFYTLDTLRAKNTGKNNKSNCKKISTKDLERLGFKSSVQLYNMYKMNSAYYENEVYLLNRVVPTDIVYEPVKFPSIPNKEYTVTDFDGTFEDLYEIILDNGYFILSNHGVYAEAINFDILNKKIMYNNKEFDTQHIKCVIKGQPFKFNVKGTIYCRVNNYKEELMNRYLAGSYKNDACQDREHLISGLLNQNLFRNYKLDDLMKYKTIDNLELNKHYEYRYSKFISYLYFRLVSGDIKFDTRFLHLRDNVFSLIIKKEWL